MPVHPALDSSTFATLACPACHGDLRAEVTRLVCASCHRAYPILEGIPVLIADHAEPTPEAR